MRFCQLDSISELIPGQRIVARRTLRAEEEYLRDHFPHFPVMPGVMMLEATYQAAMWMIRTGDDFASPLVLLKEAKGIKFADFLAPGETLEIIAELAKNDGQTATVKVSARKDDRISVVGRLVLERCRPQLPAHLGYDDDIRQRVRQQFRQLFGDTPLLTPSA
jgi:3-hydroxyacyl-[acyl-carrier-protein] dehydratase